MKRLISISIIALILLSFIGCSGKKNKVKLLLDSAYSSMRNKEFKNAKTKLDIAKVLNQWVDLEYKIEYAYEDLEFKRKLYGSISDSLLKQIIEKYNVNKINNSGEIRCYGDDCNNLYFEVFKDGNLSSLKMEFTYIVTDKYPVKYVEDIEISTDSYYYVRDYNFLKIGDKCTYTLDVYKDKKMIRDMVFNQNPVEIKFCDVNNNFDYCNKYINLSENTFKAYYEIEDNCW